MRRMPLPAVTPTDLLDACIAGITDPARSARIAGARAGLLQTAATYHGRATDRTLDLIPRVANVGPASDDDLERLYKDHMSSTRGSARRFYDAIRNAAPNGKCPLCGVGQVRTLDHHLPKSRYPDLSVCPYNLVPACDFCQAGKLAKFPISAGEQTLHPYFDDFTFEQWVFADLDLTGSPALVYRVSPPAHWPEISKQRAERHFAIFKLALVYTSNANDDLSILRLRLDALFLAGGAAAVRQHLEEERDIWATRLNSWQHAMYQALAANAWFTMGGFHAIPV